MKNIWHFFENKKNEATSRLPVGNILLAILVNLAVEILSRHSFADGLLFMVTRPLQFLYGVLLILFTTSFCLLSKHRAFFKTFSMFMWLVCGIINYFVKSFRHTPFTAQDLRLVKFALKVAPAYLSTAQIILIIILIILAVAGLVFWWINSPKLQERTNTVKYMVFIMFFWLVIYLGTKCCVALGVFSVNFGNIGKAYEDYGFAYCFSNSLLNSGIEKPKNYTDDTINEILEKMEWYENQLAEFEKESREESESPSLTEENTTQENSETVDNSEEISDEKDDNLNSEDEEEKKNICDESHPNIIFLQLESVFNPELLKDVTFSEEVLPNLNRLSKEYPTGLLFVPSVGAGTANTEFEVISGMNLDDFGPGEYPYKTVLVRNACESICFDLKRYGYSTHAIHNNEGTFYDRCEVFPQLGFDTFTSVEYMNGIERNSIGWAKDQVLIQEIVDILDTNEHSSFVYAISVQGHGDYPADYEIKEEDIIIEGEIVEDYILPFTYYVNEIHEVDKFVGELVDALENVDEPTVLVMYGDHIPAFDIENENLSEGTIYSTRYVLWNNLGLGQEEEVPLQAYQLGSYVLEMLELEGGAIITYHNTFKNTPEEEYLEGLKLLEYDILYGDVLVYDRKLPYQSTNMQMGHRNIEISSIKIVEEHLVVTGNGFTPYSLIKINGEYAETVFVDENMLIADNVNVKDKDKIAVVQRGRDGRVLSSTSIYNYNDRYK